MKRRWYIIFVRFSITSTISTNRNMLQILQLRVSPSRAGHNEEHINPRMIETDDGTYSTALNSDFSLKKTIRQDLYYNSPLHRPPSSYSAIKCLLSPNERMRGVTQEYCSFPSCTRTNGVPSITSSVIISIIISIILLQLWNAISRERQPPINHHWASMMPVLLGTRC